MLWFGLMLLVSLVMFVFIPGCLRFILNCVYVRAEISKVKNTLPLATTMAKPLAMTRKEIPDPPSSPPPRHALKSFREFTLAA